MFAVIFTLLILFTPNYHRNLAQCQKCFWDHPKHDSEYHQLVKFHYNFQMLTLPQGRLCLAFSQNANFTFQSAATICAENPAASLWNLESLAELQVVWPTYTDVSKISWHIAQQAGNCRIFQNSFKTAAVQCNEMHGLVCKYVWQYNCQWDIGAEVHNVYKNAIGYRTYFFGYSDSDQGKDCLPPYWNTRLRCPGAELVHDGTFTDCSATCTTIHDDPPVKRKPITFKCNGTIVTYYRNTTCNTHVSCPDIVTTFVTRVTTSVKTLVLAKTTAKSTMTVVTNKRVVATTTPAPGLTVIHIVVIALSLFVLIAVIVMGIICCAMKKVFGRRKKHDASARKTTAKNVGQSAGSNESPSAHSGRDHAANTKPGRKKTAEVFVSLAAPPARVVANQAAASPVTPGPPKCPRPVPLAKEKSRA